MREVELGADGGKREGVRGGHPSLFGSRGEVHGKKIENATAVVVEDEKDDGFVCEESEGRDVVKCGEVADPCGNGKARMRDARDMS